jgi:hypothetical protein
MTTLTRQCAYCGRIHTPMGWARVVPSPECIGAVSHGICEDCAVGGAFEIGGRVRLTLRPREVAEIGGAK